MVRVSVYRYVSKLLWQKIIVCFNVWMFKKCHYSRDTVRRRHSVCVYLHSVYCNLSVFSPRRRDHLLCCHFTVNDLGSCLPSVCRKVTRPLCVFLFHPNSFALPLHTYCLVFFSLFVFMCLSLQCSRLLKARRLIQKTGSVWRCVVRILSSLLFLGENVLCQPPLQTPWRFQKLITFLSVSLSIFSYSLFVFLLDSEESRGSLHPHLRGSLQVSASGEERLGTAVSPISLNIVLCVCVRARVIRSKRRKCVPGQNWLTFVRHLPPQRDDQRGGSEVQIGRGESVLGGREGQIAASSVWHKKEKRKKSLYVSRCRKLLSVVWHPLLICECVCARGQHMRRFFTWTEQSL